MTVETADLLDAAFAAHCESDPWASGTERRDHLVGLEITTPEDVDWFLDLQFQWGPPWREHADPALTTEPAEG